MAQVLKFLPELKGQELTYIAEIFKEMNDEEAQLFSGIYRARRRDPILLLVSSLALFVLGVGGIQRFLVGQIGMGILFILTAGLCFIGNIIDAVNYERMAFEYNSKVAKEVLLIMNNDSKENG